MRENKMDPETRLREAGRRLEAGAAMTPTDDERNNDVLEASAPEHAHPGHMAVYYTTPEGTTYGLQVALDPMSKGARIDLENLAVSLLLGLSDCGLAKRPDTGSMT